MIRDVFTKKSAKQYLTASLSCMCEKFVEALRRDLTLLKLTLLESNQLQLALLQLDFSNCYYCPQLTSNQLIWLTAKWFYSCHLLCLLFTFLFEISLDNFQFVLEVINLQISLEKENFFAVTFQRIPISNTLLMDVSGIDFFL